MNSLPRITHPTDRPNFSRVQANGITYWFSYETCIAFQGLDGPLTVRKNDWGPTTGKHLNEVDGGGTGAKARRVDGGEFARKLSEVSA